MMMMIMRVVMMLVMVVAMMTAMLMLSSSLPWSMLLFGVVALSAYVVVADGALHVAMTPVSPL